MSFEFNNETPIYLQIIEHIKNSIISKKYLPKDKLPSVRELSILFGVNPNTIQKALAELENDGLIITERTNGKFITDDEEIIKSIMEDTINKKINKFLDDMSVIGITKQDVLQRLNNIIKE